jgi:hypothetical protein
MTKTSVADLTTTIITLVPPTHVISIYHKINDTQAFAHAISVCSMYCTLEG